ncbi:lipopolysaccharide biosynthesis protein, partial [Lachnospiraceae bacterium SGI.054]
FLVFLKWGLNGYFAANILSYLMPSLYIMFRLRIWKYFTNNYDHALETEMYSYSKPLIFNTLAWWINNVSDRYIVTWLCGVAANGIYSMAYKIPSVLNIFQSIFSQAWTISAVKEFNKSGTDFYCKVYKAYNCGMVIICSALIVVDKVLAKFLFAKDFYIAWRYAPFLMISVVFGALSGLLGGIFSAAKKSKIFASTTMIGASVNTVLNVGLVYLWGPVGAAIATAISYCLVWLTRYKKANEIIHLSIAFKRDVFSYCILVIQACFLILTDGTAMYGVEILLFMVVLIVYAKDIFNMYEDVRIKFDEKNKLNEN